MQVFSYKREEQETVISLNLKEKKWQVWSSIPVHITKLMKLEGTNIIIDSVDKTGKATAVKCTLDADQIIIARKKK